MELIKDYIRPKSSQSEYSEENVKYLVMTTGYTYRLVNRIEEIKSIIEELAFCPEKLDLNFIYDTTWGQGLYINKSYDKELVDYILSKVDYSDGIVVFSCKKSAPKFMFMDLAKEIVDLDYCQNCGLTDVTVLKFNKDKILIMDYDCESG